MRRACGRPTGRVLHIYLNPERAIDEAAQAVHGISAEFLADKPRFAEVAAQVIDFVDDAATEECVFEIALGAVQELVDEDDVTRFVLGLE